jgi:hypothetical protein
VRRFATFALLLSLVLGLTTTSHLFAQDEKKAEAPKADEKKADEKKADEKKVEAPKADEKKAEAPKAEEKKADEKKAEAPKAEEKKEAPSAAATEPPLPPIPPDVEAKLEAARRAVAEAIVAAQDAGLVQTSIDPPPILDILITGRATDEKSLKARTGVSPEVFGAWFTGYGKTQDIKADKDVRIINPSAGLKEWYDKRANMLSTHIKAVRDAKGGGEKKEETKKEETKKEETKKAEEPAKK